MSKILSIVIPVWNKSHFTKACVTDLSKLPEDHEIIIVDNGSTDDTKKLLENNSRIVYQCNPENLGFAKACNIGYGLATAPNVLFLNNDIKVRSNHEDWTAPLIKWSSQAIVGPTMGQLDDKLNFVQEANRPLPGKSYMGGWCVAASKEIWEQLRIKCDRDIIFTDHFDPIAQAPQIFSEEFGLAYFEDTDLSFRARKLGIPFQIVEIPVVHFGKQTSAQLNVHKFYSEARQIFIKKWGR
jgi:GT2 family glycosyltransferase